MDSYEENHNFPLWSLYPLIISLWDTPSLTLTLTLWRPGNCFRWKTSPIPGKNAHFFIHSLVWDRLAVLGTGSD